MDSDRLRRAEAEAEVVLLRQELARLEDELERLARKNERLTSALHTLRDGGLDEAMQQLVEDALGFDGRDIDLRVDFELSGFDLMPGEPDDEVS